MQKETKIHVLPLIDMTDLQRQTRHSIKIKNYRKIKIKTLQVKPKTKHTQNQNPTKEKNFG